jgi:hypothetical protein
VSFVLNDIQKVSEAMSFSGCYGIGLRQRTRRANISIMAARDER